MKCAGKVVCAVPYIAETMYVFMIKGVCTGRSTDEKGGEFYGCTQRGHAALYRILLLCGIILSAVIHCVSETPSPPPLSRRARGTKAAISSRVEYT